ncbi:oligopeptide:H+ symporter [Porticoccaceae bacterium]|jgi:POT family proton-dependent oligopeptide transporter|nr:MFS transporter [Porticoccaceae bacterium]MBT6319139.1 MFS transporter [Porticoccaceae bacterium]MBT7257706.1 MFS transporter [Porticoccaceae bacterium]MDB2554139.1 oligopeptide:H+ symporter [Porticoccaceae bacterium]MDC0953325.1 oligopeptide:H+ symporter [Porticoccaceae bacterium]
MAESAEKTILGHPRGLVILFLTEMWERFSYYGMRGLLIIYLTQHFLMSDESSSVLYGAYGALVYVMTIIGGSLADRYLGARKAVTFGAILLTFGHFGMAFEGEGSRQLISHGDNQYEIILDGRGGDARQQIVTDLGSSYVSFTETSMDIAEPGAVGLVPSIDRSEFTMSVETEEKYLNILYLSLALIIAGVGFLKANISTIVGSLYGFGDARRDSGFTIFYMGINIGAFLASLSCGYLGIVHGWKYGFGLAGAGMLLGLVIFLSCQSWLDGKAEPPSVEKLKEKVLFGINVEWLCYSVGLGIIAVSMLLVMNADLVGGILGPVGILMFIWLVSHAFTQLQGDERSRMLAAIYFVLAQIPFWALFEQAGSSLNLFTARLVDREIMGWSVPGPVFQSLNAGFIFLFAPLMAWLWVWLARRKLNPSTPVKFALGVAMAGLGFLALVAGMQGSGAVGLTPVIFIFLIYWIHTMGELMVSPVGLSAVTKLAPAKIVGMTMGAWFLYSGLSNYLAGVIARTTGAETIGGQMTNVAAAKAGYVDVYAQVGYIALGIALLMLLISPVINKMMRGAD